MAMLALHLCHILFVQLWHERVLPKFWHGNVCMYVHTFVCVYVFVYVCIYIHTLQAGLYNLIMKLHKDILPRVTISQLLQAKIPLSMSKRCKCQFCPTLSGRYHSNLKVISWASLNTVRWHEHILVLLLDSYTELIYSGKFVPFSLHF